MLAPRGSLRWIPIFVLLAYSCFPLAWSLIVVKGTTPPLSGGGAGMGELGSYTYLDLSDRLHPVLGELVGSLLLLSFPLAFVACGVMLRREMRRRDDQKIEEQVREAQAQFEAREPALVAKAMLTGRINALREIAQEIQSEWPGADLASGTEALQTMRGCAVVRRQASEMMDEIGAAGHDDELVERLRRVRDSVSRCEREAQSVIASRN